MGKNVNSEEEWFMLAQLQRLWSWAALLLDLWRDKIAFMAEGSFHHMEARKQRKKQGSIKEGTRHNVGLQGHSPVPHSLLVKSAC